MKIRISLVFLLFLCASLFTPANAQTSAERMDNLTGLYMMRASEPMCGFKLTDEQRGEVLKASRFLEEKLELSNEKADELYKKVVQSMETQKAAGLCDPNGEWAQAFKQSANSFAQPAASPAIPPPAVQTKLTGLDAGKAILGNTITGRREGKNFTDYYASDGRVVAMEEDEIEIGSWTLEGDKMCTNFESEGKICYRVEVAGETATFIGKSQTGYRGTILKGNAKNL